jgi:hypothetical protein
VGKGGVVERVSACWDRYVRRDTVVGVKGGGNGRRGGGDVVREVFDGRLKGVSRVLVGLGVEKLNNGG